MKLLCASNNLAFVHGLRIALDGEGIEHHFSDADTTMSSIAGPMTGSAARLYVINDADWPRAVELFRELDAPAAPEAAGRDDPPPSQPWPKWAVVGASAVAFAVLGWVLSH
ncbi:MAG: hypothetical protein ACRC2H_03490 [Silanimonas sp.]